jgi:hypothetical protein
MPVSSRRSELLAYLEPFQVGSGRQPDFREMDHLQTLIRDLAKENPVPDIEAEFIRLGGLWRCIFTSSRFVLGLNRLRVAQLSAVYQSIVIDPDGKAGHYFNIGEMSRAGRVCGACGEYASIHPSGAGAGRLDVQYQWFYAALRVWSLYEGFKSLSERLETGHVHRKIRVPFHKAGWQWNAYLDDRLRVVFGSEGGIFVLVREPSASSI